MREWLTVIIALLILAVVLDGLRRMRAARRGSIRMGSGKRQSKAGGKGDEYGSELPNGGARVVNVRKQDDAQELYRKIREEREAKKRRLGRPNRIPQQVALNLDEHVPTLMEVEQGQQDSSSDKVARSEKASARKRHKAAVAQEILVEDDPLAFDGDDRIEPQLSAEPEDDIEDEISDEAYFGAGAEPVAPASSPASRVESSGQESSRKNHTWQDGELEVFPDETADERILESHYKEDQYLEDKEELGEEASDEDEEAAFREPEDVLVINVTAPKGQRFRGDLLLDTVLERGMRFGSMNIFHHHDSHHGDGGVLYSMANIVVPGTFDLATMKDDFTTPGVSLFLALPVDADSSEAFESMLTTAKAIASRLQGELKDENRSVLTAQTIEHYRSRIKEFERKRLSRPD